MPSEITTLFDKGGYKMYPHSFRTIEAGGIAFAAAKGREKFVGLARSGDLLPSPVFSADLPSGGSVGLYPLTWENYVKLKDVLRIAPTPYSRDASFGTGDRLGLVSAAHLRAMRSYPVFPVIAQQSPRELVRTQRSFKSVLLDAVMGVLESGYDGPFGADADHIKDEQYLIEGADAGYSMYTLDVSDWLRDASGLSTDGLSETSKKIINEFGGTTVGGYAFSSDELTKSALIYEKSMDHVREFNDILKSKLSAFDIEVSIDEGSRDTTPEDHLFVAEYLHRASVKFDSLAPKFPGEFQKGIDYVGDMAALERSLNVHAELARQMACPEPGRSGGYRLSLHSGSDKFSVYPMLGKATQGNFHIKTSGTSWLQAVKLIAAVDTGFLAELYDLCLENLAESKNAYHVNITREDFPTQLPADVIGFFEQPDVRQLFHISYGVLLDNAGGRIFETLRSNEAKHYDFVAEHIERHLQLLY